MTPTVVLPVLVGVLYTAGVYLLLDRSLTRVVLGFLLLGNATNLLLLSTGGPAGRAPIVGRADPEQMNDPLPQALILTAIVITFGVSAFLLAMVHRSWRLVRQEVVEIDEEDRRVAGGHATDADELDPHQLDPADRPAGAGSPMTDRDVERLLEQRYAGIPSDDVALPPTEDRRQGRTR